MSNAEAWVALLESSGNSSAALTLVSSEEYLIAKRLGTRDRGIPAHLSLVPMAVELDNRWDRPVRMSQGMGESGTEDYPTLPRRRCDDVSIFVASVFEG